MKTSNLMLHCGAAKAERAEVEIVPTPDPTPTWTPIPHMALIERVESTLAANGLTIVKQAHSLTKGGRRYFGLMHIANGSENDVYGWVLGLRNSHDKVFPAAMVAGASVFVCDNLSFSGEVKFARKHTLNIMRDLPALTQSAVGRLMERWHHQDERFEAYKNSALTDSAAHDLVIRALDVRACTILQVPKVLGEWRHPRHDEFNDRTVWSLFNSFTEALKGGFEQLPGRTERLHGLLDHHVGLPAFEPALHSLN
jgi:hypothetical protein